MPSSLTLILGGARSGKSARALALAEAAGAERIFIATAEAFDTEMAERIARHQDERGPGWRTVEAPLDLAEAVSAAPPDLPLTVDCLTLWLNNLMLHGRDLTAETRTLLQALARRDGPAFLVSNEIGLGLVPETPLGRAFRDAQGRLNQAAAKAADRVEFIAAGCVLTLKG